LLINLLTPCRHSSPKHYPRTNSPKVHHEYRPNINDLKQIFDDSKRINVGAKSKNYNDAWTSQLSQDEIFSDGKSRSEFERVKQKFDSRNSAKSHHANSSAKNSSRKSERLSGSQRSARVSEKHFDDSKPKMNIHDNSPVYDCDASVSQPGFQKQLQAQTSQEKQDNTVDLACSFNLDGFKVSEDDDDDGDVSSSIV
jgi:hypothetical protein